MSFRSRLTTFFLLIVMVPMVGVGLLVFRLISDSQQAKVDARASGIAAEAQSTYASEVVTARAEARAVGNDAALVPGPRLTAQLRSLRAKAGLTRIELVRSGQVIAEVGDPNAVAPGAAAVSGRPGPPITVYVSSVTAAQYVQGLANPGIGAVASQNGRTLFADPASASAHVFRGRGEIKLGGVDYRFVAQKFAGFPGATVDVTVLSDVNATASSVSDSRLVAAAFIAGFLLLALGFSVLASRALEGQLGRFLEAARSLAGGDFTAEVPVEGSDEFAALGVEFNNMSSQLARRLQELSEERRRLRDSIGRIGKTFASNLDRPALLELALRASMDAVHADCGRLTVRPSPEEPLAETLRLGSLIGAEAQFIEAERLALRERELGEAVGDEISVAAITVGSADAGGSTAAVITVARRSPFSDDDRELMRSLARQATLALENVQLHFQVRRQAVTDELTGLVNHGRFQELLSTELEQVRRYHHPVGLIMIDIDNFKWVNDTYGHQHGDVVLREVARVLRETSRDADAPARYGGEELALILPHTDLEGAYVIAERVRTAIEALKIRQPETDEPLRVTASLGVAAATGGEKVGLIADADAALYTAKRSGKNRTVRAPFVAANLPGGE
jgi:diguanylate cyclase (GGDEF)-like protein